jgi:hypothetical protein
MYTVMVANAYHSSGCCATAAAAAAGGGAGFDVWMPNTRGTTFGRGNFIHSYRDFEYWQHSIDEWVSKLLSIAIWIVVLLGLVEKVNIN